MRDSGLLHQLLNINTTDTLHGHPIRGASGEGFVIEQIIALLPDWLPHFYRTSNGAELVLLMLRSDQILAFEIKAAMAPKLTKGFYTAREDVKAAQTYIVSRTNDTCKTADGSIHTNLSVLPQQLAEWD